MSAGAPSISTADAACACVSPLHSSRHMFSSEIRTDAFAYALAIDSAFASPCCVALRLPTMASAGRASRSMRPCR